MALKLFNTLTRSVEAFVPLSDARVTIYSCGPTVRNFAHIGNFRTFLTVDLLRRYLEYRGYDVFMVTNITDVDDNTIRDAESAGKSLAEHTAPFIDAYFEDLEYLRIKPADQYPRATENIESMIALVERLLENGVAYRAGDGSVYFAVDRFEGYGRLSRLDKRELKAGAGAGPGGTVQADEYAKEDLRDFALWKKTQPIDEKVGAAWDAPFGRGRPGWHLECSAMALKAIRERYGLDTLDIHAGGVDLIFPHHENEIAQSECSTGRPFARFWVHGEFLTVEGTKMSKRYGNFLTARDLAEGGVEPSAIRLLMFQTHYRQQLAFSDRGLKAAEEAVERLEEFRARVLDASEGTRIDDGAREPAAVRAFLDEFEAAMDDDLNAPRAVAAVFSFVRTANRELDSGTWGSAEAAFSLSAIDRVMEVLDLIPSEVTLTGDLEGWIEEKIQARRAARSNKDYALADQIRRELAERGVEVEDTPEGTKWRLKRSTVG